MGIRSRFQPAVLAVALATFACFLGIGPLSARFGEFRFTAPDAHH